MRQLLAWVVLAWTAGNAVAGAQIVESIPNANGGNSTLYGQNSHRCKGSNFLADATDRQGTVTGNGCWQHYADGYLIFVLEGGGTGDFVRFSRADIAQAKAARDGERVGGDPEQPLDVGWEGGLGQPWVPAPDTEQCSARPAPGQPGATQPATGVGALTLAMSMRVTTPPPVNVR
jgi:hypothetical protein